MKKILACCLSLLVIGAMTGNVYAHSIPVGTVSAADAAAVTEPQAVFSNVAVKAGEPLKVELLNLTATSISYEWTVGGEKISNNSDSYTPTENDYEKTIIVTVTADGKAYTASLYFSELPVVYLNTNTDEDITSKDEYVKGTCSIQGNGEFDNEAQLYTGDVKIRGRGNYTWEHPKKPYKIKLDTKADLFGMGANKHWVLIAEYVDPTHVRNGVMPGISETLGMEYTATNQPVVVVLNGEYNGLYHLSENIRIGKERVNIFDWEDTAEDIAKAVYKADGLTKDDRDNLEDTLVENLEWVTSGTFTYNNKTYQVSDYVTLPDGITGGYLLELDTYDAYHTKQVSDFETTGAQPIQFKSPEYAVTNSEMYEYAKNEIQKFEDAVSSDDFYTENLHYSEIFDMDSLVKYWMVLELTSNSDGMRFSNYMYKDFGTIWKIGPAWDYDWTWNAGYTVPTNEWWSSQSYYNESVHWYKYLVKDPYFITKAYELYQAHQSELAEIYADGGKIDSYAAKIETAALADTVKWHSGNDWASEVSKTKAYVAERYEWLDKQFTDPETLAASLGCHTSDKLEIAGISTQNGKLVITAEAGVTSAETVTFHVNGKYAGEAKVQDDLSASLEISPALLEKSSTALNTVQIRVKDADGNYLKESSSSGRGGWGWNPWEQSSDTNEIYSNFKTFTADYASLAKSEYTESDLRILQDYLLGKKPTIPDGKNYDLNGDGIWNIYDLNLLKKLLLK